MDDRGIVIFMVDEKMSPAVGKQLLKVLLVWLLQSFTLIFANILTVAYILFIIKNHPSCHQLKTLSCRPAKILETLEN